MTSKRPQTKHKTKKKSGKFLFLLTVLLGREEEFSLLLMIILASKQMLWKISIIFHTIRFPAN